MQLQLSPDGLQSSYWDELYLLIKQYVGPQGYTVITYRSKAIKLRIKRKARIISDR